MAIMGKKCWAVCCGALRNRFEFYLTISTLIEYRNKGLLDGIVLSTWKGEIEAMDTDLRGKLNILGIKLVELVPLDESIDKYTNLVAARQLYQLKSGLDVIPNDVFVLKCRTDFSLDGIGLFKEILEGKTDLSLGSHGSLDFGLCYRIAVTVFSVIVPFLFGDMAFIGYKSDIMQMTDISFDIYNGCIKVIPDNRFFVNVFKKKFPFLDEAFAHIIFYNPVICEKIRTVALKQGDDFWLPEILNKVYALNFIVMNCCFHYVVRNKNERELGTFSIADVFVGNINAGTRYGIKNTVIDNPNAVRMIVEGNCNNTIGYRKLYREIFKFTNNNYSRTCNISFDEYDELSLWCKNVLEFEPGFYVKKVSRPFDNINFYLKSNFNDSMNLLINGMTMSKKDFYYVCDNLVQGCYSGFYQRFCDCLDEIEGLCPVLSAAVYGSVGRSRKPWVLKKIAELAISFGDERYGNIVGDSFEKYRFADKYLYDFPLNTIKMEGVYLYGAFKESCGSDITIPKRLYERLNQHFNVNSDIAVLPENDESITYSDRTIHLVKEVINMRYAERETDIDIKNLVDFWIDMADVSQLSEEAFEFLSVYSIRRKATLPFMYADDNAVNNMLNLAKSVKHTDEAEEISRIMIREKYACTKEEQEEIDIIINGFLEKGLIRDVNFVSAVHAKTLDDLVISDDISNENWIITVRTLEKRNMLDNVAKIVKIAETSAFRRIVFELFYKIHDYDRVSFLAINTLDRRLWFNYTSEKYRDFERKFYLIRDDDGHKWPYAQKASKSPCAANVKIGNNRIFLSIEMSAQLSLKKGRLIKLLNAEMGSNLREDIPTNIFFQKDYIFTDSEASVLIEQSINEIFEEMNRMGEIMESVYERYIDIENHNMWE